MAVSDFHRNMMSAAINQRSDGVHRRNSPSTDDVRIVTKKRSTPASKNRPSLLSRKMGTAMPVNEVIKNPMGPAATKVGTRPKTRSNNAYTPAGTKHERAGTRYNPSLFQRILDTSVTYNLFSMIGRKVRGYADPRG